MASLTIAGVPPLDGDYDLDISRFTNRELHTIKEISGVRAGELKAAVEAADNDLIVAFAVIVLRRAGKTVEPDQLWDADSGAITVTPDAAETEPPPPLSPSPSGNENEPGGDGGTSDNTPPSGRGSSNGGDAPANHPSPTGHLGSASFPSDPVTSAT